MRYWSGVASGVCALAIGFFCILALFFIPDYVGMYSQFGGAQLPAITALVMSPAWHWTVPAASIVALVALNQSRIDNEARRAIALAVSAGLLLSALVFTYYALTWPMRQLAGNIG